MWFQAEEVKKLFGCSISGGEIRVLVTAAYRRRRGGVTAEGTMAPENVEEFDDESDDGYEEDHCQSSGKLTKSHFLCASVWSLKLLIYELV